MRALATVALVSLAAACLAASAFGGGAPTPTTRPIGGYLANPWPVQAAANAKAVAKASFARNYSTVWSYLHPTYQKAVSQSHWQNCQGAHPAAPKSVTITKVSIADATKLPTKLPLLGTQNIQEIQIQVQFKNPAAQGTQYAVEYTFWLKQGNKWQAVWLPDEFTAYKTGHCYITPQGPPLY
ncbi:MAG: hypothetical protein JO186_06225 [Actinobacteria bacterium]|nr:hypothetical protein [Actinomycetota bacterium]MBV8396884.1 hypothetical protein [Actinomycetota bacterium]